MTSTYTLKVTEADNPGCLAEALGELERRCGCAVSCDALDRRLRRQRRDSYLAAAHALMPGDTLSKKCHELAAAIARFEGTTWLRWRDYGTLPERFGVVGRSLFEARKLGPLPGSPKQVYNIIVKRKGRGNFIEKPVQSPPDPE